MIVTNEDQPGWYWDQEHLTTFKPTRIDKAVNVIGAGDTFFAGLVFAHQQQLNFAQTIDFASRLAARRCQVETIHSLQPCKLIP
jgi:sugar/nucleoside kinase (ribokinase family)